MSKDSLAKDLNFVGVVIIIMIVVFIASQIERDFKFEWLEKKN